MENKRAVTGKKFQNFQKDFDSLILWPAKMVLSWVMLIWLALLRNIYKYTLCSKTKNTISSFYLFFEQIRVNAKLLVVSLSINETEGNYTT